MLDLIGSRSARRAEADIRTAKRERDWSELDLTVFHSNRFDLDASRDRGRSIEAAAADFSFMVHRSLRQFSQDKWCRMSFGGERRGGREGR